MFLEKKRKKIFYDQISLGNAGLSKIGELSFLYDFFRSFDLLIAPRLSKIDLQYAAFPPNSLFTESLF